MSVGHTIEEPVHVSWRSQVPAVAPRHTVPDDEASSGQVGELPVH